MKLPVSDVEAANLARAVHAAMNTVIQEVGTSFDINRLCKEPPQPGAKVFDNEINVVALAAATSRITATAELFGVDAETLVSLARYPKEAAHRHKLLARIARFMDRMSSLFYPDMGDDCGTVDVEGDDHADSAHDNENEDDTCEPETDDDKDCDGRDDEVECAAARPASKRDAKRLEAAVTERVETVCWAREETELAMGDLEESFRALIKAKDAHRDD